MSADPDLLRFAKSLMRQVRDRAIDACDRFAAGDAAGPMAEQWRSALHSSDTRSALTALVPDIVDQVLFELLDRIDNNRLPLAWGRGNGEWVPLSDLGLGEMAGWLMGSEGAWRQSFSERRFNDYLANLRLSGGVPADDSPRPPSPPS